MERPWGGRIALRWFHSAPIDLIIIFVCFPSITRVTVSYKDSTEILTAVLLMKVGAKIVPKSSLPRPLVLLLPVAPAVHHLPGWQAHAATWPSSRCLAWTKFIARRGHSTTTNVPCAARHTWRRSNAVVTHESVANSLEMLPGIIDLKKKKNEKECIILIPLFRIVVLCISLIRLHRGCTSMNQEYYRTRPSTYAQNRICTVRSSLLLVIKIWKVNLDLADMYQRSRCTVPHSSYATDEDRYSIGKNIFPTIK